MIDFGTSEKQAEMFRAITREELSAPLKDDNRLLHYLAEVGYLKDVEPSGYLPAALFVYQEQPDAAEILVDRPMGEAALTRNGGPVFTYESTHSRLDSIRGSNGILSTNTGNVIETTSQDRLFMPKAESTVSAMIKHGGLTHGAVEEACQEVGVFGIASSLDFVDPTYHYSFDLSFTRAIRVAAGWASYQYTKPWNPNTQDYYSRTFEESEVLACLKASIAAISRSEPYRDIDIINRIVRE